MRDSDDLGKSQSSGQRGGDLMTNLWYEQENKELGTESLVGLAEAI